MISKDWNDFMRTFYIEITETRKTVVPVEAETEKEKSPWIKLHPVHSPWKRWKKTGLRIEKGYR